MIEKTLRRIKDENIEFIDFRFSDLNSNWKNITFHSSKITKDLLTEGVSFDGSSIESWKEIQNSDMLLKPDLSTCFQDPFSPNNNLTIICDIFDPQTQENYLKDPRTIAKKAQQFISKSKIADKAFFGPELEFFIFDHVKFSSSSSKASVQLNSEELDANNSKEFGGLGYGIPSNAGYFTAEPSDRHSAIRSEILKIISEIGVNPSLHHHEVASSQSEVGFDFAELLESSDNVQKVKYVIKNVVSSFGKSASFMPKPLASENGSGMHVHQSLWKNKQAIFAGDKYADLSQESLHYIGGIIKHAKTINAFSNPSTNSYKRLVPGFEAPIHLAFSSYNRSASIRIPHASSKNATRIEVRFPDATANPYLAFSAMLMAGIDGIKNKIDPGLAIQENLYKINEETSNKIPKVAGSLTEALTALDQNRDFLLAGNVFNNEIIDSYIKLKKKEIEKINNSLSPEEFLMYYVR